MENECNSVLMAQKLEQLNALISMVHRTLDSNDSSIYLREAVNLMETAGELVCTCEAIRQSMDVELYQKTSKYYDSAQPSL